MKLEHLHYGSCPVCKARVVSEKQNPRYSNGQWFERVGFECGHEIAWVPNFSREECRQSCPNSPEMIELMKKRKQAKNNLENFIEEMDVDEIYKDKLKMELKYL